MLPDVICPFSNWIVCFTIEFKSFVHYRNQSFVVYVVAQIIFRFIANHIILLTGSFTEQKL